MINRKSWTRDTQWKNVFWDCNWKYPKYPTIYSVHLFNRISQLVGLVLKKSPHQMSIVHGQNNMKQKYIDHFMLALPIYFVSYKCYASFCSYMRRKTATLMCLSYLVNYFGCINASRNVYMNFALLFAYAYGKWYVKELGTWKVLKQCSPLHKLEIVGIRLIFWSVWFFDRLHGRKTDEFWRLEVEIWLTVM